MKYLCSISKEKQQPRRRRRRPRSLEDKINNKIEHKTEDDDEDDDNYDDDDDDDNSYDSLTGTSSSTSSSSFVDRSQNVHDENNSRSTIQTVVIGSSSTKTIEPSSILTLTSITSARVIAYRSVKAQITIACIVNLFAFYYIFLPTLPLPFLSNYQSIIRSFIIDPFRSYHHLHHQQQQQKVIVTDGKQSFDHPHPHPHPHHDDRNASLPRTYIIILERIRYVAANCAIALLCALAAEQYKEYLRLVRDIRHEQPEVSLTERMRLGARIRRAERSHIRCASQAALIFAYLVCFAFADDAGDAGDADDQNNNNNNNNNFERLNRFKRTAIMLNALYVIARAASCFGFFSGSSRRNFNSVFSFLIIYVPLSVCAGLLLKQQLYRVVLSPGGV